MYRFIQDYDGHWYLIPEEKTEEFEQWVYNCLIGENETFSVDFDLMRIYHPSRYICENVVKELEEE